MVSFKFILNDSEPSTGNTSLTFQNIYVLNVFGFLIENRVVGILNPKVMDNRNGSGGSSKNEVSFSIDHPDKIIELGDSVDVSRCQAKKNDGSGCTNLVKICKKHHVTFKFFANFEFVLNFFIGLIVGKQGELRVLHVSREQGLQKHELQTGRPSKCLQRNRREFGCPFKDHEQNCAQRLVHGFVKTK